MLKNQFMQEAIQLAKQGIQSSEGGPFGAVIVKDNQIIGRGNNRVLSTNDPTAHAEVVAIRDAAKHLNHFSLEGCEIYTNCEPCPMCLAAIYWARIKTIYYGADRNDAAKIGFDDELFYQEIEKPLSKRSTPMVSCMHEESLEPFRAWSLKQDKTMY